MALLGARRTQQRSRQAFPRSLIVEGVQAISCVFLSRGALALSRDVMTYNCNQPPGVQMQ